MKSKLTLAKQKISKNISYLMSFLILTVSFQNCSSKFEAASGLNSTSNSSTSSTGGSSSNSGSSASNPSPGSVLKTYNTNLLEISYISALPVIAKGQSTNIDFSILGTANKVTLNPGNIDITLVRSIAVSPQVSTVYTITATNSAGQSYQRDITVNVNESISKPSTSVTPNFSRIETPSAWDYKAKYASRINCASNEGAVYRVGPGQDYTDIDNVPWFLVKACDQVLIYYRSTPYNKGIFLGSRGEIGKYILIKGVPGPNGERPMFDGNNAILPKDGPNAKYPSFGMIYLFRPITGSYSSSSGYKPGYIEISGFKFQNIRAPSKMQNYYSPDQSGNYLTNTPISWPGFSSGITVDMGEHLVISNNEFADNALGFFVNSGGGEIQQSRDILITHNYFHGSGYPDDFHQHNSYTEAVGTIYQFNYFGKPLASAGADGVKDRSAGVIFRYNYLEGGCNNIALRDPESNGGYEGEQVDAYGARNADLVFIYSNIFIKPSFCWNKSGMTNLIGIGDGQPNKSSGQIRKGNLYFYNNRVIAKGDITDYMYNYKYHALFDELNMLKGTPYPGYDANGNPITLYSDYTSSPVKIVARNNLFYSTSVTPGVQPIPFALFTWQGAADFSSNWITSFTNHRIDSADNNTYIGSAYDGSNLGGLTAVSAAADPGFVDSANNNYLTTSTSPFASLNAVLPDDVLQRGLLVGSDPVSTPWGH